MSSCAPGLTLGGTTAHFTVCFDPSLTNGQALAGDALARCEQDLATLAGFWQGTAAPASVRVSIVSGSGGATHIGADVTMYANSATDGLGIPGLLVEELSEVFMATQEAALGKGFNPGYSHGEGLSRVLAEELYPDVAGRFSTGDSWLNSARPDWVTSTDPSDQHLLSFACAQLFLNYLRHQLGFGWPQIIAAADNTLALVAQNLGVPSAPADFFAVIARHFAPGQPYQLPRDPEGLTIDNLFPLTCLYMRRDLSDDGTSHSGALPVSPDIIVKNSAVADPQATYSTAASIASDSESDANVIESQDNYVYLRAWNLGADATDVNATVYWSSSANLATPTMWNIIGTTEYPDVPAGRVVEVSAPGITWSQGAIPAPGQYSLIATVGKTGDPAPALPASFASVPDLEAYIEANNNVTWRDFNVGATGPSASWTPTSINFPSISLNSKVTESVAIRNTGTLDLHVISVTATTNGKPAGFSVNVPSLRVPPGQTGWLLVTFTSTLASPFGYQTSGNLSFVTDDPVHQRGNVPLSASVQALGCLAAPAAPLVAVAQKVAARVREFRRPRGS